MGNLQDQPIAFQYQNGLIVIVDDLGGIPIWGINPPLSTPKMKSSIHHSYHVGKHPSTMDAMKQDTVLNHPKIINLNIDTRENPVQSKLNSLCCKYVETRIFRIIEHTSNICLSV